MGNLKAGVARVDVTPPVGTPLGGFAGRIGPSQGVHDPLYAKALALSDGDKTAILIVADLLSVPRDLVEGVRASIQGITGVGQGDVMVAATHTHSGPETIGIRAGPDDPYVSAYLKVLERYLVGVAYVAWKKMAEARIGGSKGDAVIGFNRRKRGDPIDSEVGVIRIDDVEGNPRVAVINYPCHAVVLGGENLLISADYPGYVNGVLERVKGLSFTSMFTNGAAGNINPLSSVGYTCPGTFRDAERLGSIIAGEALKTLEQTETSGEAKIQTSSVTHYLSMEEPPIAEAERYVRDAQQKVAELKEKGAEPNKIAPYEAVLEYYERNLRLLKEEQAKEMRLPLEVQVFRMNDIALVAVPGEMFVEIGREIKAQSGVKNTFIIGYANGYIGYIPTLKAFEEGGYEPTRTWWNRATPEAGKIIKEGSLKQLEAMRMMPISHKFWRKIKKLSSKIEDKA